MGKLADAVETVEIWVDLWSDEQAEVEDADVCDEEERKVIEAVRTVLKAIKGKGEIPDPGEGYRFCSHKVAESYWDGQAWRDLGPYQAGADWYRRRIAGSRSVQDIAESAGIETTSIQGEDIEVLTGKRMHQD